MSYRAVSSFFSTLKAAALVFFFACYFPVFSQVSKDKPKAADSTVSVTTNDTTKTVLDSVRISSSALGSRVNYHARDSVIFDVASKKVYLYGDAHIDYEDLTLDAAFITIDWTKNEIYAEGVTDSTGKLTGTPHFKQGEQDLKSKKMAYNFKTKRGRVNDIITAEGEGFIHSETVKTIKEKNKDIIYARNAKYTTCNLEVPHYYIQTNKLKLIPKDKVLTGPAYIVVEGVPIPLILPFGFFPANSRKTSGLIIPTVGESSTQGFALRNGGFYYGGSKYFDAAVTGDIYSSGQYRAGIVSNYARRYHFNGSLSASYARNQVGLKETPEFRVEPNYQITWNHSQDVKAHPGSSFNSSVHLVSSGFMKRNTYDPTSILTQNVSSSVSYSKTFRGTPFSVSASLRHSQNLATHLVDLTLPDISLSMQRIYPFKSRYAIGDKWYHKIGVSSQLQLKNQLTTTDSTFTRDIDIRKFRNGAHITTPVSTSFNIWRYFSFTPSLTHEAYFYSRAVSQRYDTTSKGGDSTVYTYTQGFHVAQAWNASASLATHVYGTLNLRHGHIKAIRHVLTPTITGTYRPDFGKAPYSYYRKPEMDSLKKLPQYFIYDQSIIGSPGLGEVGAISFSLENNFEMKVANPKDTAHPTKKIKLLDHFNIASGYNFLADSFQLSTFFLDARTTLFEKYSIQGSTTLDPYYFDEYGKRHREYQYDVNKKLGTFTTATLSGGTSFNQKGQTNSPRLMTVYNPYLGYYYSQPYANFDLPWNLNINYMVGYSRFGKFIKDAPPKPSIRSSINLSGDLSLTKKWRISYYTGYDFAAKKIAISKFSVFRDLHCWEMSFDWIPFGAYQSYFFNIHIKAASLRDLKFDKRKEYYDFQ